MNLVIADATVEENSKICNAEVQPGSTHKWNIIIRLAANHYLQFDHNPTSLGTKIAFDYHREMKYSQEIKTHKQARTILPLQTMYIIVVASYYTT